MSKKTIGIIGGMGPMASCDLMKKIIEMEHTFRDQDHVHLCMDCNTNIPDRTEAILHGGEDPVPEIVRSAISLQGMGAQVLIMSCNTAHYFYDRILPFIDIPLLHMIRETAAVVKAEGLHRVALLATDGTLQSGIYEEPFAEEGIELLYPTAEEQAIVMAAIYDGVKAGNRDFDTASLQRVVDNLCSRGAEAMILGCTELPLAFEWYQIQGKTLDPTTVLAHAALHFVGAI